ncbi:MAG: hypothetical protein ACI8PD_001459, partial [Nitrospinales bacterium]
LSGTRLTRGETQPALFRGHPRPPLVDRSFSEGVIHPLDLEVFGSTRTFSRRMGNPTLNIPRTFSQSLLYSDSSEDKSTASEEAMDAGTETLEAGGEGIPMLVNMVQSSGTDPSALPETDGQLAKAFGFEAVGLIDLFGIKLGASGLSGVKQAVQGFRAEKSAVPAFQLEKAALHQQQQSSEANEAVVDSLQKQVVSYNMKLTQFLKESGLFKSKTLKNRDVLYARKTKINKQQFENFIAHSLNRLPEGEESLALRSLLESFNDLPFNRSMRGTRTVKAGYDAVSLCLQAALLRLRHDDPLGFRKIPVDEISLVANSVLHDMQYPDSDLAGSAEFMLLKEAKIFGADDRFNHQSYAVMVENLEDASAMKRPDYESAFNPDGNSDSWTSTHHAHNWFGFLLNNGVVNEQGFFLEGITTSEERMKDLFVKRYADTFGMSESDVRDSLPPRASLLTFPFEHFKESLILLEEISAQKVSLMESALDQVGVIKDSDLNRFSSPPLSIDLPAETVRASLIDNGILLTNSTANLEGLKNENVLEATFLSLIAEAEGRPFGEVLESFLNLEGNYREQYLQFKQTLQAIGDQKSNSQHASLNREMAPATALLLGAKTVKSVSLMTSGGTAIAKSVVKSIGFAQHIAADAVVSTGTLFGLTVAGGITGIAAGTAGLSIAVYKHHDESHTNGILSKQNDYLEQKQSLLEARFMPPILTLDQSLAQLRAIDAQIHGLEYRMSDQWKGVPLTKDERNDYYLKLVRENGKKELALEAIFRSATTTTERGLQEDLSHLNSEIAGLDRKIEGFNNPSPAEIGIAKARICVIDETLRDKHIPKTNLEIHAFQNERRDLYKNLNLTPPALRSPDQIGSFRADSTMITVFSNQNQQLRAQGKTDDIVVKRDALSATIAQKTRQIIHNSQMIFYRNRFTPKQIQKVEAQNEQLKIDLIQATDAYLLANMAVMSTEELRDFIPTMPPQTAVRLAEKTVQTFGREARVLFLETEIAKNKLEVSNNNLKKWKGLGTAGGTSMVGGASMAIVGGIVGAPFTLGGSLIATAIGTAVLASVTGGSAGYSYYHGVMGNQKLAAANFGLQFELALLTT